MDDQFRLAIDTIPGLVWSSLPDGHVDFLNKRWCDYTGMTMEDAVGWGWQASVATEDLPGLVATWLQVLSSGEPGEAVARLRRSDGVLRWFLFRAMPLRDETGAVVKWYGETTDIEDRKCAEDALRRSEANLARAQQLSSTGSFAYHAPSGQLTLSDETLRICGFERGTVVAPEAMRDLIHPDDVGMFRAMLADGSSSEFRFSCRLRLADGTVKYLQVAASTIRDGGNQVVEWVGAVRDITEQRRSEDALHQVQAELAHVARAATLGALTASIAHEINQPLAGIVTNASTCVRLLGEEQPNIEGARETARRTIRDANRAADVIARLRALFRKKSVVVETLDLNEAIREVIALLRRDLEASRVSLRTELSGKLRPITGDRVQLQQVVMNLILNAVDAMNALDDGARRLVVKTETIGGEHVRVLVEDSGVGLDAAESDRIFEAFYTSKQDGMGMGLAVSRSIVEGHRGRLWAESNEGGGATFVFSLPVGTAVTTAEPASASEIPVEV